MLDSVTSGCHKYSAGGIRGFCNGCENNRGRESRFCVRQRTGKISKESGEPATLPQLASVCISEMRNLAY